MLNGGKPASVGLNLFRQIVPRPPSRLLKRQTGQPWAVRFVWIFLSAPSERCAGAPGLMRAALGSLGGGAFEQHQRQAVLHVPGHAVGQFLQEHICADPLFAAVADQADVQVGAEPPKNPLDIRERLL